MKKGSCSFSFSIPASTSHPTPAEWRPWKPRRPSWKCPHPEEDYIEAAPQPKTPHLSGPRYNSEKRVASPGQPHASPAVKSTVKKTEDKTTRWSRMPRPASRVWRSRCSEMKKKTLGQPWLHHTGCHQQRYYRHTWLVPNVIHFSH